MNHKLKGLKSKAMFTFVGGMLVINPAFAQDPAPQQPAAQQAQTTTEDASTLDTIVVTGARDAGEAVAAYVERVTVETDDQVARFAAPVCPAAFGLLPEQNAFVAERLRLIADHLGVGRARDGCRPNVVVVVADSGGDFVRALRAERPELFAAFEAIDVRRIGRLDGPARAWQRVEPRGADGRMLQAIEIGRERRVVPGVFAQDELALSRRWTLLAGLRADHHEAHGTIASPRLASIQPVLQLGTKFLPGRHLFLHPRLEDDEPVLSEPEAPDADPAMRGPRAYLLNCASCHGIDRGGDTQGTFPSLEGVGDRFTRDEIASIIAFDGNRVGVMWSDQRGDAVYFALRTDGEPDDVWTGPEAAIRGRGIHKFSAR